MVKKFNYYPTPLSITADIEKFYFSDELNYFIDLGAGKGDLLKPFIKKGIKSDSFEIDEHHLEDLAKSGTQPRHCNLLTKKLSKCYKQQVAKNKTLILSNPPFTKIHSSNSTLKLLQRHELWAKDSHPKTLRMELVFLARALEVASKKTKLCFILPYSFITSPLFRKARETLTKKHCLISIHINPSSMFAGTEVKSITIFIEAYTKCVNKIALVNNEHNETIFIDSDSFESISLPQKKTHTMADLGVSITRGRSCAKSLREKCLSFIHSKDLTKSHGMDINGDKKYINSQFCNEKTAKTGDLLVSRVGSRCLGKVARVSQGYVVLSDSVIRIRAPEALSKPLLKFLISSDAQCYLEKNARGSCAKIITYDTIRDMPVYL